jgi:hypothetical protein
MDLALLINTPYAKYLEEAQNKGAGVHPHPCFGETLAVWLLEPIEWCVTSVI